MNTYSFGKLAALQAYGIDPTSFDTTGEEVALARKLHAAGVGGAISKGMPGLTPQQQSNLRKNYLGAMDMSAHPKYRVPTLVKAALLSA